MNLKKSFAKYSLQDWVFLIFSVLWISIVVLDYLNKQVVYLPSIVHFKYFNLTGFLLIIGTLLSMSYCSVGPLKRWKPIPVNGLVIFSLFISIVCVITLSYNKYWNAPLNISNYLHLVGKGLYTVGCSLFIVLSAYSSGNFLRNKAALNIRMHSTALLVDIALGFVIYHFALMILGSFALLNQVLILGLLILMIAINYKNAFLFIKIILWDRIQKPKSLGWIGALIGFGILVYITLNYFYTQAPFPLGFDARNYYVNISRLIADAEGLIPGFQPYAWGLIMSTGYIAFDSPEITLFISILGGLLSLFAIYELSAQYFKLSSTYSFLVVLLYLLTPTVTNHFIIEFKVDLALLFFQIITIILFIYWLFKSGKKEKILENKRDWKFLALIGVLLGFSLAIKVLSAFLIFGIFLGLWWFNKDIIGVVGLSAAALGLILLTGFDEISGLRKYHLSPGISGLILMTGGIIALGYSLLKERLCFFDGIKALCFCSIIVVLTFSPWMYKNYSYTKSLSVTKLLLGDKPRPKLRHDQLDKRYQEFLEKDQSDN